MSNSSFDNDKDKEYYNTNLFVLTHRVSQWNKTWLELIRSQSSSSGFVKVIKGGSEFIELLLSDAFGVSGQNLVFNLVDGSIDWKI